MALNYSGLQKHPDRQRPRKQAKYKKLYSDLVYALNKRTTDSSGVSAKETVLATTAVPKTLFTVL